MTSDCELPVLISGAGPTGLTLAVTLRRYGVPVRLIDQAPVPATVSKALAMWSGSLEALAGLGVIDRFVAAGVRLNALRIGDGKRQLATLKVGDGIDSPYPYPLLLPQGVTESILTARAAELGLTVERGVELVGFKQDETGVTAELRAHDGRAETVRAVYLVGADGARSFVRRSLGIEFEGYTEPQTYLLGDVRIDGDLDHQSIYVWWHGGGTVAMFPFEEATWRIFAVRKDDKNDAPCTVEELQGHIDLHGPPGLRLHSPSWLSTFRINERLALRYRDGRVFLAGDAAHIHSPAGGQGMNTGIQDAVNLGWKLAAVLRGKGDSTLLLDSYEAERRPIARAVIAGAAQKLHAAFASSGIARMLRDVAVSLAGNIPAAQRALQIELSETEIVYQDGPLVSFATQPRRWRRTDVGSRARDARYIDANNAEASLWRTLSGPHHTLLVFEEPDKTLSLGGITDAFAGDLTVLRLGPESDWHGEVRDRYHISPPGWVLIRPDQVVAARGGPGDLAQLANYLEHVLGAQPRAAASRPRETVTS
ncbi:FAD-binding monooxygenase [Pseudolabrys sp. Root1462]|uniref:FAD-dependent monooxygenase n=1 Tax=Pseudolabrys sp. Root1462 TaxID=1736466 RepID=UPI00070328FE|nr:FAD-dependent monooxygenase [Pseudolabrys sp. Root1462]KQZ00599.1 FAD-binding monooxygenase [Pseudolabrys sp. Root1462]